VEQIFFLALCQKMLPEASLECFENVQKMIYEFWKVSNVTLEQILVKILLDILRFKKYICTNYDIYIWNAFFNFLGRNFFIQKKIAIYKTTAYYVKLCESWIRVNIFLVRKSELVSHLILHFFNSWKQNNCDSNLKIFF